jgi:glycosyltransferase involved in cell wall biosynthesis
MKILFTEQFYYPEGWGGAELPRDLTMHLARSGVDVEVICGADQYAPVEGAVSEDPRSAGVRIRRTPRLFGGKIHRLKLLKQITFYLASVPLLFFRRAPDLFVTQTNPPLIVPLVAVAALLCRRPFVIIAQDIYPEVMFAHGMSRPQSVAGKVLTRMFSWAYRRARRVVALGPVMKQRLVDKGVAPERIEVISNWATGDESIVRGAANDFIRQWQLTGRFVILYSGNVGIAHDIKTPIVALSIVLRSSPNACLLFVGSGSRLEEARALAASLGISQAVHFRPPVSAADMPLSLGVADLALVTLRENFAGLVVPSKLLGYMARGMPTLYIGPYSDIERMLLDAAGGLAFRNDDPQTVADAILKMIHEPRRLDAIGAAAAAYYREHFSQSHGLRDYAALFRSVMQDDNRGSHSSHGR